MPKKCISVVICFIIIIAMIGCSQEANLYGKWVTEDGNFSVEFFENGTLIMGSTTSDDPFFTETGSFSVVENNKISYELDGFWGMGGEQTVYYEISGNELFFNGRSYKKK